MSTLLKKYQALLNKKYLATRKESTAKSYICCLKKACDAIEEHYDFLRLTHSDLLELVVNWQFDGLAHSTINNRLTQLRELCQVAYNDKKTKWKANPCDDLKCLLRDQMFEKLLFTKEEMQRLENTSTLQHSAKRMALFAYHSGIRMEEAVVLSWQDIDWEKGTLSICRARALDYCHTPKTHQSSRTIALSKRALTLLKDQWAVSGDAPQQTVPMRGSSIKSKTVVEIAPIFIDDLTGKMFKNSKDYAQRFFTAFLKQAKVKHRGPSVLRHTYASHALSSGVNIAFIAKTLGHVDTKTTEAHYAKYIQSYQDDDVAMLDAALSLTPSSASKKTSFLSKVLHGSQKFKARIGAFFSSSSNLNALQHNRPAHTASDMQSTQHA
ncbi:tyrosine-type recombinase/integrase [Vibrio alfacsensis]|uniref:tyrosine-type recombinase/integrase n=1 Tax=Vibrio alfacsensis TaxID=1074311 RepID=UPI004067B09E